MGMDEVAFDAEGNIGEGLAIDEEVEVVKGEGLERIFQVHGVELAKRWYSGFRILYA